MKNDDICALSTPAGAGGVAVIRISGQNPLTYTEKMFTPSGKTAVKDFEPYRLYTGTILCEGFKDGFRLGIQFIVAGLGGEKQP